MNILTVIGLILLARTAAGQSPSSAGTASGNLVVDGKPIPLKYAYVVDVDNVEEVGLQIASSQHYRVIVLSDREIPAKSVCDRNAPTSERISPVQMMEPPINAVVDKMNGIVLKIDPKQANPLSADLFYPNKDTVSFNVIGTEYPDRVINMKVEGGYLTGVAELAKATETHLSKGPKKYSYRVSFRAPIITEPAVTANLTGKEALDSPPIAAMKAYLAACKTGNADALLKLTAESHSAYLKRKEILDYLKSGDAGKLAEQVKRVVVRGKYAAVVCVNEQPTYSEVTMHLINENGAWKVQWP